MTAAGFVGPIGRTDARRLRIRVHCCHPFMCVRVTAGPPGGPARMEPPFSPTDATTHLALQFHAIRQLFATPPRAFRLFAAAVEEAVDRSGQAPPPPPLLPRLPAPGAPLRPLFQGYA